MTRRDGSRFRVRAIGPVYHLFVIGSETTVCWTGDLDVSRRPELESAIDSALASKPDTLVIDLGAVTFVDSGALGVLVQARNRCYEYGATVRLVGTPPRLTSLLRTTGLDTVFGS